jgi:hypothetical protein
MHFLYLEEPVLFHRRTAPDLTSFQGWPRKENRLLFLKRTDMLTMRLRRVKGKIRIQHAAGER